MRMSLDARQSCRRPGPRSFRYRTSDRGGAATQVGEIRRAHGNEVGARAAKFANLIDSLCIGDARNFKQFSPPRNPLDQSVPRRAAALGVGLAEHHVVGAKLARRMASSRVLRPPTPAMRCGLSRDIAASSAAMPVRCAPSAPARSGKLRIAIEQKRHVHGSAP